MEVQNPSPNITNQNKPNTKTKIQSKTKLTPRNPDPQGPVQRPYGHLDWQLTLPASTPTRHCTVRFSACLCTMTSYHPNFGGPEARPRPLTPPAAPRPQEGFAEPEERLTAASRRVALSENDAGSAHARHWRAFDRGPLTVSVVVTFALLCPVVDGLLKVDALGKVAAGGRMGSLLGGSEVEFRSESRWSNGFKQEHGNL